MSSIPKEDSLWKNLLFKHFSYIHTMSGKHYNTHKAMTKLLICTYFILFAFQNVCWELERTYISHQFKIMSFDSYDFLYFLFSFSFFFFFLYFFLFSLYCFCQLILWKKKYLFTFPWYFTICFRKGSVFHQLHERDLTLYHHQIEWSTLSLNFL